MIAKNTLYFFTMKRDYFEEYEKLDEFQKDYDRGHGVMIIDLNNLLIAVPLRSSLPAYMEKKARHLFPYKTYINQEGKEKLKALDFSKTTIIEERHINNKTKYLFKDVNEEIFYLDNFKRIELRLRNYIEKYIGVCEDINNGIDINKHTLKQYVYTTLRNFHEQLGIEISSEDFIELLQEKGFDI